MNVNWMIITNDDDQAAAAVEWNWKHPDFWKQKSRYATLNKVYSILAIELLLNWWVKHAAMVVVIWGFFFVAKKNSDKQVGGALTDFP